MATPHSEQLSVEPGVRVAEAGRGTSLPGIELPFSFRLRWGLIAALIVSLMGGLIWLGNHGLHVSHPSVTTFEYGQRITEAGTGGPLLVASEPELFTKPCYFSGSSRLCQMRFQIDIDPAIPDTPNEPLALFMPTWRGELRIFLNGDLLVESRWFASGHALAQNPPIIRILPAGLLRPSGNLLELHISGVTFWGDAPGEIQIGPEQILRAKKNQLDLFALEIPQGIDAVSLVFGALLIVISALAKRNRHIFHVGTLMLVLTLGSVPLFFTDPKFDPLVASSNFLRMMIGPILWALTWRWIYPERPLPTVRRFFFLVPVFAWIAYLVFPGSLVVILAGVIPILLCFVPGTMAMVEALSRMRQTPNDDGAMLLGAALFVGYFSVSYDVFHLSFARGHVDFSLLRYGTGVMVLLLCVLLLLEYLSQLQLDENRRQKLRSSVAQVRLELLRIHDQKKNEQARCLVEQERGRLMADLHDGLSGQLVSIQALCAEGGPDLNRRVDDAAQRAMVDLELVVGAFSAAPGDLMQLLASLRDSMAPQVNWAGMEFEWQLRPLPCDVHIPPRDALNLSRLLAEAFTNAIRHSGGTRIRFEGHADPADHNLITLAVIDNGVGGALARAHGRGLRNMQRRAEALGGQLVFESSGSGTQVRLRLPVQPV